MESPGKLLQNARLQLGLLPEDVSRATKMRPSQVLALEKDDYTSFASITYARNFVQLYARFLKIDVSEALEGLSVPKRIGVENYQYLNAPQDEKAEAAYRPSRRRSSEPRMGASNSGKWALAIVIILPLLIFAIMLLINLQRLGLGSHSDTTAGDAALLAATPEEITTPYPTPEITPGPTPASFYQSTPVPTPPGSMELEIRPSATAPSGL